MTGNPVDHAAPRRIWPYLLALFPLALLVVALLTSSPSFGGDPRPMPSTGYLIIGLGLALMVAGLLVIRATNGRPAVLGGIALSFLGAFVIVMAPAILLILSNLGQPQKPPTIGRSAIERPLPDSSTTGAHSRLTLLA